MHRPRAALCETPAGLGVLYWSMSSETVGVSGNFGPASSRLKKVAYKALLAPRVIRLASKERLNGKGAAMNLAALDPKIDVGSARIAGDDSEFCSATSCNNLGRYESGPVTPVAPHLGGSLAVRTSSMLLYGVSARMYICDGPRSRRADPSKLRPVKLDFCSAQELI